MHKYSPMTLLYYKRGVVQMKKFMSIILTVTMAGALLVGCSRKNRKKLIR